MMANPTLQSTSTRDALEYQPLSGWAVGGFALGIIYAVAVLASAVFALLMREPFFLPGWSILTPILAVAVSIIGQSQINNSEGTRAGAKLAKWGLWLGLLSGLGYFAYTQVTKLALVQQAKTFLLREKADEQSKSDKGFFTLLKGGTPHEIVRAFLLTKYPTTQATITPQEIDSLLKKQHNFPGKQGEPGPLPSFRKTNWVKAICQSGKLCEINAYSVKNWAWEKGGYRLNLNVRVQTPELNLELLMPVQSATVGGRRRWYVDFEKVYMVNEELTRLGKQNIELRKLAAQGVAAYLENFQSKKSGIKYDDVTEYETLSDEKDIREFVRTALREHITKGKSAGVQKYGSQPGEKQLYAIEKRDDTYVTKHGFDAMMVHRKASFYINVQGYFVVQCPVARAHNPAAWTVQSACVDWIGPFRPEKEKGPG